MIPLTRPLLGAEESDALGAVLSSGMLVSGKRVEAFESLLADHCGRSHAIAVNSGTAALELALRAVGVAPGDEVLVPCLTWPSPAHAVRLLGATPILIDVDPEEWNASAAGYAAARNERTTAAVVIDQFGNPIRAREVLSALEGLAVVEDAACALGSVSDQGPCGGLGDVSCMSFHPRKVITTGEGGVCLTNDSELAGRLRALRNHGQSAPGHFEEPAGNHRLTDLAGALGEAQMARLEGIVDERRERASRYRAALNELLRFQRCPEGGRENGQTFGALLPEGSSRKERDRLVSALAEEGIQAGRLSYALSRVPTVGAPKASTPISESIVDRGLALPLFPGMGDDAQDRVIDALRRCL